MANLQDLENSANDHHVAVNVLLLYSWESDPRDELIHRENARNE